MDQSPMPDKTHVGHVHLQVGDLKRALDFYRDLLGFREVRQKNGNAVLSATGQRPHHFFLTERTGAQPKPARTTGLYHVAIRFPTRLALARTFQRLVFREWPFQGFADHLVSEALYLADPEGNGLELYVDRPREQWSRRNGQIEMATEPLHVEGLLADAVRDSAPWTGVHPQTDIGHVHLHVSDLARAEAYYHGILGLDVTQRGYPGALFLSAGGYHHHLGLNIWAGAGAPPPPADAVGLLSFSLQIPDGEAWRNLRERVRKSGVQVEDQRDNEHARGILVRDPDGNGVELLVENTKTQTSNGGTR